MKYYAIVSRRGIWIERTKEELGGTKILNLFVSQKAAEKKAEYLSKRDKLSYKIKTVEVK